MASRRSSHNGNSKSVGLLLIALDTLRSVADSAIEAQDTMVLGGTMKIITQICILIDLASKV